MKELSLIRYLTLPRTGNFEGMQKAQFLHIALCVSALSTIPMGIINIREGAVSFGIVLFIFGSLAFLGVIANHHGFYLPTALFLLLFVLFSILYTIIDGAALNDPGVVALPLFILMTGLLFDKKLVILSTMISVAALLSLYLTHSFGWLELSTPPLLGRVLILSILMVATGFISWSNSTMLERNLAEIRKHDIKFRALFLQSAIAVFTFEDGVFVDCNAKTLEILGFDLDKVIGKSPLDFSPSTQPDGDKSSEKMDSIMSAVTQGISQHFIWQHQRLDGSLFDVDIFLQRVDLDGRNLLLGIINDLTAQKRAEIELRENARRYQVFVEGSPEFIWHLELRPPMSLDLPIEEQIEWLLQKSFLVDANEDHVLLAGFPKGEILGSNLLQIGGNDHILSTATLTDFIDRDYKLTMHEMLVHDVHGTPVWLLHNAASIIENNHLIRIWGTSIDISERKAAENQLRASKEYAESLIETANAMVIGLNTKGNITTFNKAAEEITGYRRDEVLNSNWFELVVPEEQFLDVWGVFNQLHTGNLPSNFENPIITKSGEERYIVWQNNVRKENNEIVGTISFGIDITERKQAEEAIRQSEEKFHAVFMASPYSICVLRLADGKFVDVNKGFENRVGYSMDELLGRDALELGLLKDPGLYETMFKQVVDKGSVQDLELELVHKDGHVSTSLISAIVIDIGDEPHLVSIGMDISLLRESERLLLESDARNRLILQSLPMAFYRAYPDPTMGNIWVSEQIKELAGVSPEDMLRPEFWDSRLHPHDRERIIKAFENLPETQSLVVEYRWKHADGSYRWIQDNAVLTRDSDGSPMEIVGTWMDITERKRIDQGLRESEARYRTLFNETTDGISILRGDKFIDINSTWLKMFGLSRNQVLGKTPFEFSPVLQPDGHLSVERGQEYIKRSILDGPQRFDWQHQGVDGSIFDTEISLNRIELNGEELLLAILRDLTDRKRAETAAYEERQRLARDLHDAVSQTLWSASLIADVLPELWDQNIDRGREALQRLRQLNQGALAEMRTLLLELRPSALLETPIEDLFQRLIDASASHTTAKIEFQTDGVCQIPQDVHVALYRIAQESLNNATRHADAKKIEVYLRCQPEHVLLIVRDSGRGFDPLHITPGQHLGLSIMRERAESINAMLDIESQLSTGTVVKLEWHKDRGQGDEGNKNHSGDDRR